MEKPVLRPLVLSAALGIAAACATTSPSPTAAAQGAAVVVLSLQDITCRSCGTQCIDALKGKDGVVDVGFDEKAAELTVRYEPDRLSEEAIVAAVGQLGYGVEVGEGKGRYAEQVEWPDDADLVVISPAGEAAVLEEHLVPGKVTVVDFFAEWCGPCRFVDRRLLSYAEVRDDVAVRKINVVDWSSPAAKAFLQDVPQLPYVIVFGKDGERVDAIAGLDLERLDRAVAAGGAQ